MKKLKGENKPTCPICNGVPLDIEIEGLKQENTDLRKKVQEIKELRENICKADNIQGHTCYYHLAKGIDKILTDNTGSEKE